MKNVFSFVFIFLFINSFLANCVEGYECRINEVGNSYVIVDGSNVFMSQKVYGSVFDSGNGDKINFSGGEKFEIKQVDDALRRYLVDFGNKTAFYSCSGLDMDLMFSNVVPKSKVEKIDKNIGKKVWLTNKVKIIYKDHDSKELFSINKPKEASIESRVLGYKEGSPYKEIYYKILFSSGGFFYISEEFYERYVSSGDIIVDSLGIEKAKSELDLQELQKEKNDIINKLKTYGINIGEALWTKYPEPELPGLSKIKIKDITLERDTPKNYYDKTIRKKIVIFAICENNNEIKYEYDVDIEKISQDFYRKNIGKGWSKRALNAINNKNIYIGMTKKQVLTSWGRPKDVNRMVGSWGVHEQWVYPGSYLYFENGILSSFQD
ncbi:hypothetical protein [Desulfuromonas sp. CSMB_57]|uniref:hypothetical protein n=1 Tax=Desulfuromonas sp. CSMB_57 TaxID=2807629 RepID=UPI0020BE9476|nr:hypothetical protein [Desulfuromonas sp. CSMB_57]